MDNDNDDKKDGDDYGDANRCMNINKECMNFLSSSIKKRCCSKSSIL